MNRALFVPRQHVLEFLIFVEGIVYVEHRPPGVAEDILNALFNQGPHDNFTSRQAGGRHSKELQLNGGCRR